MDINDQLILTATNNITDRLSFLLFLCVSAMKRLTSAKVDDFIYNIVLTRLVSELEPARPLTDPTGDDVFV